jgi:hypothetical protein
VIRGPRLRVSLALGRAPWQTLGRAGTVQLGTEWQAYRLVVQPDSGAKNARLVFDPSMQNGRIWLAGISLRPGGVTGLPPGEMLQAGTVAGLPHEKLADRSLSATRDWVRFLWATEDAYWQTLSGNGPPNGPFLPQQGVSVAFGRLGWRRWRPSIAAIRRAALFRCFGRCGPTRANLMCLEASVGATDAPRQLEFGHRCRRDRCGQARCLWTRWRSRPTRQRRPSSGFPAWSETTRCPERPFRRAHPCRSRASRASLRRTVSFSVALI